MKIKQLLDNMERIVPNNLSLDFDNVGLLIGDYESDITGVYISLDVNNEVIEEVSKKKINTIISHHPIIFSPLKSIVNYGKSDDNKLIKCILNNINVISCHTNLDSVRGGMNDQFLNLLELNYKKLEILKINKLDNESGIGRVLELARPININFIIDRIKKKFNIKFLRLVDSGNTCIKKICFINGSGNSMISECFNKNIDLIVTGDINYHTAFTALEHRITLIDMGHFNSENIVYKKVMEKILKDIIKEDIEIYYDNILSDVYKYV